jgi:cell division septum initiation protein DivIVA
VETPKVKVFEKQANASAQPRLGQASKTNKMKQNMSKQSNDKRRLQSRKVECQRNFKDKRSNGKQIKSEDKQEENPKYQKINRNGIKQEQQMECQKTKGQKGKKQGKET